MVNGGGDCLIQRCQSKYHQTSFSITETKKWNDQSVLALTSLKLMLKMAGRQTAVLLQK